jgi:hypothetical protein
MVHLAWESVHRQGRWVAKAFCYFWPDQPGKAVHGRRFSPASRNEKLICSLQKLSLINAIIDRLYYQASFRFRNLCVRFAKRLLRHYNKDQFSPFSSFRFFGPACFCFYRALFILRFRTTVRNDNLLLSSTPKD